mmetsp:Transcript_24902/g.30606  ORF Transcript_24902/g.30606 Transcript_24902/m.30606 type:complete len:342 (+) Transcript_24902:149-1174(+)
MKKQNPLIFVIAAFCIVGAIIGVVFIVNDDGPQNVASKPDKSDPSDPSDPFEGDVYSQVGCIKTPIVDSGHSSTTEFPYIVEENIAYGKGKVQNGDKDLYMDVYRPDILVDGLRYPLMIHIHGGSFISGSKSDSYIISLSEFWASQGFVVASINYRLVGDSPIVSDAMESVRDYVIENLSDVLQSSAQGVAATCAVEDTLTAYDYLKKLSYVNPDEVIMNGYSAGAITALWATYGIDTFGISPPPVKAVLSHWGMLVTDKDATETMVPSNEPPAFLVHATGDSIVPYDGTQLLANRFETLEKPYALHCQESGSHSIDIDKTMHSDDMTILEAENLWLSSIM